MDLDRVLFRAVLALFFAFRLADAQAGFRTIKALSGPSGKVVGSKYELDEVRSNSEFPKHKELLVYFEWEGAPGKHHLSGVWKDPSGKSVQISDIELDAKTSEMAAYWQFALVEDMTPGVWELQVRIDGLPAGSHVLSLAIPPPKKVEAVPAIVRPVPTLADLFVLKRSLVWVRKVDGVGRQIDRCSGFVSAAGLVTTAFQCIDGASALEVEFSDGRKGNVDSVAGWNRM